MQTLLRVKSFADQWHRCKWRARDLPESVGADLVWRLGGSTILGFSINHPRHTAIVLNTRIQGTVLQWPVVYHESAHVIQGDLLGYCGNAWAERQCERDATDGSTLLAIPEDAAVQMVQGRATIRELAVHFEVPRPMVYMRGALAVLLGEVAGDMEAARRTLQRSRSHLDRWLRHPEFLLP